MESGWPWHHDQEFDPFADHWAPECRAAPAVAVKRALRHAARASLQLWTVSKVPACVDAPL